MSIVEKLMAGSLFASIALAVVAAIVAALIAGAILWLIFFILRPYDKPKPEERKRIRSLVNAKGPRHTVIIDPHPDAHGDVVRAAWPGKTMGA